MAIDVFSDVPKLRRLSDYVFHWADIDPDGPAMALANAPALRWTHRQFADDVNALAKALIAAGINPGDRVALLSPPNPQFAICFFAVISVGAIFVGINPKYQRGEMIHVVADSAPTLVLAYACIESRQYRDDLDAVQQATPSVRTVVLIDEPASFGKFIAQGDCVSAAHLAARQAAVQPRDPCALVYTSGSVGTPKGAVLHHDGFVDTALVQLQAGTPRPLRLQNYFPINHVGCLGDIMAVTVLAGGFCVYLEHFDPQASLRLLAEHKLTLWGGVPTVFQLCLADPAFDPAQLATVELIFWGGAPCARPLIEVLRQLCPNLATNYGMTETVGAITLMAPNSDIELLSNSVGYPSPAFQVRRQRGDGTSPNDDEPAEVQVRGSAMLLNYWNQPGATAKAFTEDGFYRTGDLATINQDGSYKIAGRVSEMYKSGGYNVYPREVELALESHPAVAFAAVVGVADALYNEVGYACVVPQASVSVDELRAHCKALLANYKIPKHFDITTNPPLLPIGKIDKKALRNRAVV